MPTGEWLPEQHGHRCWWADGGDPSGVPVVIVHGGPGGASRLEPTRWFDGLPVRWIVLDQRGCGRSTPLGATDGNDLPALVADMERLRGALGLERWAVSGGSWGARVALAYAGAHPDRVAGLLLRSPFCGTAAEARRYIAGWHDWLDADGRRWLGEHVAAAVRRLYQGATALSTDARVFLGDLVGDERVAQAWAAYDDQQSAVGGVARTGTRWVADQLPAGSATLAASWAVHAHYAARGWDTAADQGPAEQAAGVPAVPVQVVWGTDDATCAPSIAQALVAALPAATGTAVAGAGHRMSDPLLAPALAAAARRWVAALRP